jgi:hypothetical protein
MIQQTAPAMIFSTSANGKIYRGTISFLKQLFWSYPFPLKKDQIKVKKPLPSFISC